MLSPSRRELVQVVRFFLVQRSRSENNTLIANALKLLRGWRLLYKFNCYMVQNVELV